MSVEVPATEFDTEEPVHCPCSPVLHVNVTAHPYAAWAAQQIVEAVGPDAHVVRPIRDRDAIYGGAARRDVLPV